MSGSSKHFDSLRSLIALLILCLAFSIFLIFYNNQQSIMQNSFYLFMVAATIAAGLLVCLLYLISNQKPVHKLSAVKAKSKPAKKKK